MDITNKKLRLRKQHLGARKKLSEEDVASKSMGIFEKVVTFDDLKNAKTVAVYLPVNNEVDTKQLISYLLGENKKVYVPAFKNNSWKFVALKSGHMFEEGPLGILQPVDDVPINVSVLDVIIVPGVAFDLSGVRLGYGKGIYDRLLANSKAKKVGLAYDFQILKNLPKDKHDLVMDFVVTEKRVI